MMSSGRLNAVAALSYDRLQPVKYAGWVIQSVTNVYIGAAAGSFDVNPVHWRT
jgi:hypothetical protein